MKIVDLPIFPPAWLADGEKGLIVSMRVRSVSTSTGSPTREPPSGLFMGTVGGVMVECTEGVTRVVSVFERGRSLKRELASSGEASKDSQLGL